MRRKYLHFYRFCEIKWFFDNITTHGRTSKKEKYFHARWFSHGSKTILGETANPQGLFLLDMCDDNPVDVILQKISVRYLGPGEKEPVVVSEKEVGSSTFHLSYVIFSINLGFSCYNKFIILL